jgi:hypothetical protein
MGAGELELRDVLSLFSLGPEAASQLALADAEEFLALVTFHVYYPEPRS